VQVAAAVLLALTPSFDLGDRPVAGLLLIGMAALAGARPVRIPSLRVNLTAAHPFVFCALAAVGPLAAVLASLAGVLGAAFGRSIVPASRHFLFNLGSAVLCAGSAWGVFAALGGSAGGELTAIIGPLIAAALAYFVLNTGLLTVAVSLERNRGLLATWRCSCRWTFVPFIAGLTLAIAMLALIDVLIPWGILLALAPSWLLLTVYRAHPGSLAH
jgi:hypothetical protein